MEFYHSIWLVIVLSSVSSIRALCTSGSSSSFKEKYKKCEEEHATCFIIKSKSYLDMLKCTTAAMHCKEALYKQRVEALQMRLNVQNTLLR